MYTLRDASPSDIPIIRDLVSQVWPQTYASILTRGQINYMLDQMYSETSLEQQMKEGARFIIAEKNGKPVGFASFQETSPGIIKLHKLYVLPSVQGKGAGHLLATHVIDYAKKAGATSLQLQVNRRNKARFFYEKLGFRIDRQEDFDIGKGYKMEDFVMELKLT